jgi:hypothetical protein
MLPLTQTGGGGGGTPGGSNTQLQYNQSGFFAGIVGVTWDGSLFGITVPVRVSGAGAGSIFGGASLFNINQTTDSPWALTVQNAVAGTLGGLALYVTNAGDVLFTNANQATLELQVAGPVLISAKDGTAVKVNNSTCAVLGDGTHGGKLSLSGSSSGNATVVTPAVAGTPTLTTPTASGVLAVVAAASGQPAFTDISGVATAAQGGVASVLTSHVGRWCNIPIGFPPGTVSTNMAISLVANRVYAIQVVIPYTLKVGNISVATGATNPNAVADFGFYDMSGNLLVSAGGINCNSTSTVFNAAIGSPVTLTPGVYWFAWCGNFTSGGFNNWNVNSIFNSGLTNNLSPAWFVHAANAGTAGVLPSTLGVVTADNFSVAIPLAFVTP